MRFVKYITAPILMVALCSLWSCSEDENTLSEAVLASASTLNYEAENSSEKLITVYADADWFVVAPDWVTVTPSSGNGVMDVTISVTDNMRGGAEDNPRKINVIFKGRTLASEAKVLVTQDGDKYRDVKEYTPGELIALKDEAVVSVPNVTVMALTTKGFIVSDQQNSGNVYIFNTTPVAVGDKVSLMGSKSTDTKLVSVGCDIVESISTGGSVSYPAATDITGLIDDYTSDVRGFISVAGLLSGNNITVAGAKFSANIIDAPASMGLAALNGHNVIVKGYFAGAAAPIIKIIAAEIEDKGVAEIVYFTEDFEWLDPWSIAGSAGKTVEDDNLGATAPQIVTPKVNDVSALDALLAKGYELLRVTTKTPGECIYLQRNYLKFGKTSYQGGIVFPKIKNIPADATTILSFEWCPMRQGEPSNKIDPVNLIVIVENGGAEVTFDIPESGFEPGHRLEWIKAKVELSGVTITADTKITIRQTQWPAATANRWFLDNIKLIKAEK